MNTASAPSTPSNTSGLSAQWLLMTPRANREPRRSLVARMYAMITHFNAIENVVVQPEPEPIAISQPVAQQIPRTPEKAHHLPMPPSARQFGSTAKVERISREEAFLRAPEVHRRRAPPKFRAHQAEKSELSTLPRSRFNHLREMGIRYRDITKEERKDQLDSARERRYYQLKYQLSEAKTDEEFNNVKEQYYL
uniref:Uncharacterized protein n=1 Tax=Panagrellus redivivus TaxID=6233 RepID=A0A7E4W8Q6_PANRE